MKLSKHFTSIAPKIVLVLAFAFGLMFLTSTPALAQGGGECHIGNPECTPMAGQGVDPIPSRMVRIAHGRYDGASYRVGEYIYIYMYHATGGYVYIYDWQPYMGNWARILWRLWLPAGRTRVAVARISPPTGPEWLTIYDPSTGYYDRTHFQVVGGYQPPGPWPPGPWSENSEADHDIVLQFDKPAGDSH